MATLEKLPMLREGYDRMQVELNRLKNKERHEVVTAIEEARAHGDLSENAEYHAAKERQGQIEATITDLEDKISRAQIIDPADLSGDKIVFGATVKMLDEDDNEKVYQIVGPYEADAKGGRISYTSPLGRALIGRREGDEVEVSTPSGEKYYEISEIVFK
ncbi:transcription elongation factor GreA [Pacificimonas flava]|uniref:Transcription elongation factor GreA n=2 Tax=Pacificimonas TaxID=1960290 RepID=A0A219B6A2_9SPHN|nr:MULTISPECIES: transcription elongation factor GreA [Pacificimonas]MBZ6378881.1 transcription elongation factor GreA [Pacificimonas aurantium]OWV33867.1 transcription elongation factor GreA [Pacificimonas flava]